MEYISGKMNKRQDAGYCYNANPGFLKAEGLKGAAFAAYSRIPAV
jgi:hypothetical protein